MERSKKPKAPKLLYLQTITYFNKKDCETTMFRLVKNNNIWYYIIEEFENTGLVRHCFTTRMGGVSKDEFKSMNLRINSCDKKENIIKNFDIICSEIGIDYRNLVFSNQVHDDLIIDVKYEHMGNGIIRDNEFISADGLITAHKNIPLVTFYADCVPLYFLDTKNKVIALSHSGWKGTVKNIANKTISKMERDYNSKCEDILCAIGPSICEKHFEVGDEVAEIFSSLPFGVVKKYGDKYHVNLQKTIYNQLLNSKIPKRNIILSNICTYCNSDFLFSHRKTNGKRGNLAAIMELK